MTGLRTELKLQQVNRRLIRRNVPLVERHGIIRDLRANLRDAEQLIGEQSALDQLGDLDDLAADYASSCHRNRPRIRAGLIAAAWTLIILATVSLVRVPTFGMIDTFDPHTGATTWHVQWWRLGAMSGDTTSDTLFEATVNSYGFGLAVAAAFILGARLWRFGRHPDHHPTSTTPA